MKQQIDLTNFNTFKITARAQYFLEINETSNIVEFIQLASTDERFFILGGGANVLFVDDFKGLVVKNNLKGIERVFENEEEVHLKISSGEDWTSLVASVVEQNLAGIENLAFIPGTVGAAVVQNIAAYGQNFEDVFESAEAVDLLSGETIIFSKKECQFSYRNSFFKGKEHQRFFITSVTIKLSKLVRAETSYHSRYESLASELVGKAEPYSVQDIFEAVVSLRKKKLPDWRTVGTAGSFFKNPVISREHFKRLSTEVTELQAYPVARLDYGTSVEQIAEDYVKVPAGRLLDELGWKGKKIGRVGTFEKTSFGDR